MIKEKLTYENAVGCDDCEVVTWDVGRHELRFCSKHAAAPTMWLKYQVLAESVEKCWPPDYLMSGDLIDALQDVEVVRGMVEGDSDEPI